MSNEPDNNDTEKPDNEIMVTSSDNLNDTTKKTEYEPAGPGGDETLTLEKDKFGLQPDVAALFAPKQSKLSSNTDDKQDDAKNEKLPENSNKTDDDAEKASLKQNDKEKNKDDKKETDSKLSLKESFNAEISLDPNSLKNLERVLKKQASLDDLVGVIANGKLHVKGKIHDIKEKQEDKTVIDLTIDSDVDDAEEILSQIEGLEDVKKISKNQLQFTFIGKPEAISWLLNILTSNGISVKWFVENKVKKSLMEDFTLKEW